MTTELTSTPEAPAREVDLAITGMTCASCSARIERKLNKLGGVQASVNLATEKAHIRYAGPLRVADLLATVEQAGYGAALVEQAAPPQPHELPDVVLRRRLAVAAVLTVPVFVLAMVIPAFPASPWLQLLLATPVVTWAAYPFHRAAAINARHRSSTMDTLVSLGVIAAYGWSLVTLMWNTTIDLEHGGAMEMSHSMAEQGHFYFEVAAVVTTFLLLGRTLEARARSAGRQALESLADLGAKTVAVLRSHPQTGAETEDTIRIEDLAVGDRFVVRPGEKVATDGVVADGHSALDTSIITGESLPVDVAPGDRVTGGTVNTHGRLVVTARSVGADTVLAAMTRLVEQAQTGKAEVQRLADRVSAVFVPIVLGIAALTLLGWLVTRHPAEQALSVAISVLIIACPCALGLATPTALLVGTGRGAQLGVLIKGPQVLEDTRRVDTVVLDKTGTVTSGVLRLDQVRTTGELSEAGALALAAAVEAGSEHPIARAVVRAAQERGMALAGASEFIAMPGLGARAVVDGVEVSVGKAGLFEAVPGRLHPTGEDTGTTVYAGWSGAARAALTLSDTVRDSSPAAVTRLRELGLTPYLLTGDHADAARRVATQVGIDEAHVIADVLPQDKYDVVRRLQAQGRVVAMVGDGINDAGALVQADLGVAMGSGTDVAMDAADIVLMRGDLDAAADAIALSRQTLRVIRQNLAWAFGYNAAAIPLAVLGLLNPMIAGATMAMSSVLVVTNSLRLRRFRVRP